MRRAVRKPEYSPATLRLFLRARAVVLGGRPSDAKIRLSKMLRRKCHATACEFDLAWMGRLFTAGPRTELWRALGHRPEEHGLRLIDDGGQEVLR